jgi:hypothetical protein
VRISARVAQHQLVELAGLELEPARGVPSGRAELDRHHDRLLAGEIARGACGRGGCRRHGGKREREGKSGIAHGLTCNCE